MLFSHRHVYKFCQRNLFFSELPKVDLSGFGNELFNSEYKEQKNMMPSRKSTYSEWALHGCTFNIIPKNNSQGIQ